MFQKHVSPIISSCMNEWCSSLWNAMELMKPNTWGVTEVLGIAKQVVILGDSRSSWWFHLTRWCARRDRSGEHACSVSGPLSFIQPSTSSSLRILSLCPIISGMSPSLGFSPQGWTLRCLTQRSRCQGIARRFAPSWVCLEVLEAGPSFDDRWCLGSSHMVHGCHICLSCYRYFAYSLLVYFNAYR
jgi:hypothetical protein